MNDFMEENRRIITFSISWIIGIVLIVNFGDILFCKKLVGANGYQFTLIVLGITILLLPFVDKLKISASGIEFSYKIERANAIVNQTIADIKAKSGVNEKNAIETVVQESDESFTPGEDVYWKVAKLRIEIEQALRIILNKRISIEKSKSIDINYYSLSKLFDFYIKEYPDSKNMEESFKLFNQIANSVIHGQRLSEEQIDRGAKLGLNIMRYFKIKKITEKINEKK